MSNDITIGNAFLNPSEGAHVNEYCTKENEIIEDDIKVRIAYIIISNEDIKELLGSNSDKQTILNNTKDKYSSYLVKAVEQEIKENNTYNKLKGVTEQIVDDKLVNLCTVKLYNSKSYGSVLKAKKYHHAYKKVLQKDLKENLEKKSTSFFTYNKNSCQQILKQEENKTSKKLDKNEQAYIIISMPYVYNIKENSKEKELEQTCYENKIIASGVVT
jgi:tRNA pseudouridine-54 N-methylase